VVIPLSPSTRRLLLLTLGDRKNKRTELNDRRLTLCHAKVGGREEEGQKHNQQNLHIIGEMQQNYLWVYSPHPLYVLQTLGVNINVLLTKMLGRRAPFSLFTSGLLSLTSDSRKK